MTDLQSKTYSRDHILEIRERLKDNEYFQSSLNGWRLSKLGDKGAWWSHYTSGMPNLIESKRFKIEGLGITEVILNDRAPRSTSFFTREEAEAALVLVKERYKKAEKEAKELLDQQEAEVNALFKRIDIHYRIDGDLDGIYDEGYIITVNVDGFEFTRKLNR